MSTVVNHQQNTRHWYNDREIFLHGLARSNYVTAITDWFMGFAGKWAELVLYATVLYSCAELYPGVHLPAGLSLAVFLVQLGALDIGGLSLAKLAKQAREDGNASGAKNAEWLSKWLIGIMLVGVVTVGLEHALPVTLPSWVITSVNVLLVVARSICAVLYGRVVHDLKQEGVNQVQVVQHEAIEQQFAAMVEQFNTRLQVVQSEIVQQVQTLVQSQVADQVQASQASQASMMEQVTAQVQANQSIIINQVQASQSTIMEVVSAQIATAMQEMKRDMRSVIAEATASSSDSSVGSSPKVARQLRSVTPLVKTEPGSEPANVRVPRFIAEQVNQGHKPTLSEIEEACQCSRNTAIRYRREQLGDDEGVA